MIRRICCALATCVGLFAAPALAQTAVLPLHLHVTATTDWTRIELKGLLVKSVAETLQVASGAEVVSPILVGNVVWMRKPVRDTSLLQLELELAVVPTGEAVQVLATRGDIGQLRIKITSEGKLLAQDVSAGDTHVSGNLRVLSLDLSQFGPALPRRDWGKRVLAFYYGWWGTPAGPAKAWEHWNPQAEHRAVHLPPQLGMYDSGDPQVVRQHLQWAKQAGIDTLVMSLWLRGKTQDAVLKVVLDEAHAAGLTVAGYLEACTNPENLREQFQGYLKAEMQHPAWLTVHGQKVMFTYTRIYEAVNEAGYKRALHGLPILAIGDGMYPQWIDVLGGMHTYVSFISPANRDEALRAMAKLTRLHDKLTVATVMPGFDDTTIRFPGRHIPREEGRFYRSTWRSAGLTDWVVLTSFNELHEGSEIEPMLPEGDLWLRRTRAFADAFRSPR